MPQFKTIATLSWWKWVGGISLFFTIVTTLIPYLPDDVRNRFIYHFNLAIEMNLAAWWAGIFLLALALLAYQLYSTSVDRTRLAWLALAVVFLALSLDEIGSFHERAGSMKDLLPFIVGFIVLIGFAWWVLYRSPGTRPAAFKLVVSFALLGSVIVQEYLEHNLDWPAWLLGIRVGFEEATELLGFLLALWAIGEQNSKERPATNSLSRVIPNPYLLKYLPGVLLFGFLFHIAISFIFGVEFEWSTRGNPVVWYPAAVFFLLFASSFWKLQDSTTLQRLSWLPISIYFLLNSAAAIYLVSPRQEISRLNFLGLFTNFYFLYAVQLGLILAFSLFIMERTRVKKTLITLLSLGLIMVFGYVYGGLVAQFVIAGVFPFIVSSLFLNDFAISPVYKPDFRRAG